MIGVECSKAIRGLILQGVVGRREVRFPDDRFRCEGQPLRPKTIGLTIRSLDPSLFAQLTRYQGGI